VTSGGMVLSPTPMVPIRSDSIRVRSTALPSVGDRRRGHPAGGAAAGDDDLRQRPIAHRDRLRSRLARILPALSASSGSRMPRAFRKMRGRRRASPNT
jgi:hypothetical protein